MRAWRPTRQPTFHPTDEDLSVGTPAGGRRYLMAAGAFQLFCAGVGAVVDVCKLRGGELGVALGGGEALVAEEFLNGAKVGAFFKQVGSEGVTQSVRMHVGWQAVQDGDALDDAADAARGEARLTAVLRFRGAAD